MSLNFNQRQPMFPAQPQQPQQPGGINFPSAPQFGTNPFRQGAAMPNTPAPMGMGRQAAMGGLGGFADALGGQMQANAAKKQQGAQNAIGLNQQQMGLAQEQLGDRQAAARFNLQATPAMSDIQPYAQAAMQRALAGGFKPVSFADDPTGSGRRVMSGGLDMSALNPVMQQFYSDQALGASAANQEALRMAVDPFSFKSGTQSAIYGNEANQGNYDDVVKFQQRRQQQYGGFENQAQDALRQALETNREAYKPDSGWKMFGKALLGGGMGAAKSFLTGGLM